MLGLLETFTLHPEQLNASVILPVLAAGVTREAIRDAFYVATHMAVRNGQKAVGIVPAPPDKAREAEFIMLRDGLIVFEGDADALRRSTDPYLQKFLS